MNIYLVKRKTPYYGSGATNEMVVIAEDAERASRIHPDSPDNYHWNVSEGVWVNWSAADMYRPDESRNDEKWPRPEKLDVNLLGKATDGWSQYNGAVILTDRQR